MILSGFIVLFFSLATKTYWNHSETALKARNAHSNGDKGKEFCYPLTPKM